MPVSSYATIQYDTDPDARVATVTLNRPDVLNAFNRQMCEEIRDVWHVIKADTRVNAVVLRGAGDRAFSAGLDVNEDFGQPELLWNHDDPGEFLSPKWQKLWKPVVCAVHGMCTAGAFYFLNEADVVICSDDATFFDSHVTYGMVSAIEPIGLMRRIGLGDTLRMALTGNRERVSAETALRLGLVSEIVPREELFASCPRTREPHRVVPRVGDARHGAGDLGIARQALPRRHGAGPHVHANRATRSVWRSSIATRCRRRRRGSVDRELGPGASRGHPRARSRGTGARVRRSLVLLVRRLDNRERRRRGDVADIGAPRNARGRDAAQPTGCGRAPPRRAARGGLRRRRELASGHRAASAPTSNRSTCPCWSVRRRTSTRSSTTTSAAGPRFSPSTTSARLRTSTCGARRVTIIRCFPASRCECSRAARPGRRSASTSATRCSSGSCREPSTTSRTRAPSSACAKAS